MCEVFGSLTEKHHDGVERILICKSGDKGLDVRVQTLSTLVGHVILTSLSLSVLTCDITVLGDR